jgi:hypothetical protein
VAVPFHRVAFYADIVYNSELSPPYWIPPHNLDVDAILLGGDIHYSPDLFAGMLKEIRDTQHASTRILVVPGNGEYIDQQLSESRQRYRAVVEAVENAYFLDDEALSLPTGLRVIGSTLWSNVSEENIDAYTKMLADHGLRGVDNITLGDRFLTLRDTNELHARARGFIEEQLRGLSDADRRSTIVCTHFWPTLRPWADSSGAVTRSIDDGFDWYQMVGSDLDSMIADHGPRYWLCGHAHTSHHVTIGTTDVCSNPRAGSGPGHVNPDFVESYVLDIPPAAV